MLFPNRRTSLFVRNLVEIDVEVEQALCLGRPSLMSKTPLRDPSLSSLSQKSRFRIQLLVVLIIQNYSSCAWKTN